MISILQLKDVKANDRVVGFIYVRESKIVPYGDGTKYRLTGDAKAKDISIPITSFDKKVLEYFQDEYNPVVCINGVISEYQGKLSLMINSVSREEHNLTKADFMKSVDIHAQTQQLIALIQMHLSSNASRVFSILMRDYRKGYTKNFAGSKMHDAFIGGLMMHSIKMFKIAVTLIHNDPRLEEYKDELLLGCLVHDFGKTVELNIDEYTKNSFVTHRTLGIEIFAQRKHEIVPLIGEDLYYRLLAIIIGHHHEYGDRATTMITYIVHLVDMLESQTTGLLDSVENKTYQVHTNGNKVLKHNGYNFVI